jgi:signal transduction histidine kinase
VTLAWLEQAPVAVIVATVVLATYGAARPVELPGGRTAHYMLDHTAFALFLVAGPSALLVTLAAAMLAGAGLLVWRAPPARVAALAISTAAIAAGIGCGHLVNELLGGGYPQAVGSSSVLLRALAVLATAVAISTVVKEAIGRRRGGWKLYAAAAIVVGPFGVAAFLVFATAGWWSWVVAVASALLVQVWFPIQAERVRRERALLAEVAARERVLALNEVTTRVAHQLRHQLGLLGMSLHRIESRGVDDPLIREEIENLGRAQDELRTLLAADGRPTPHGGAATSWTTVVERPVERLELLAGERGVRVHAELGALPAGTPSEADKLEQAWFNILENAISAARSAVWVSTRVDGAGLVLRVEDDGPGMTDEVLAHATEPFFTTKPDGTGLGLAIARAVAEEHGGELSFARAGERFRVEMTVAL